MRDYDQILIENISIALADTFSIFSQQYDLNVDEIKSMILSNPLEYRVYTGPKGVSVFEEKEGKK